MTTGRHYKKTKGVKWTEEIQEWLKARVPLREHGYAGRSDVLNELNETFGTDFTLKAFCTHCYESGIQLGLAHSFSTVARGEKHWRHRPVGSFQMKKGYIRIKVAEPNRWMQYQRYVWEQHHPGESAEGMTVIFMDGDNRNFDPSNLERVTRGELSAMAEFGHSKDMTRAEREICLLRARIAIAKSEMAGRKEAALLHKKLYYRRVVKNNPEMIARRKAYARERHKKLWADPELRERELQRQREYRARNRERFNAWMREYQRKRSRNG